MSQKRNLVPLTIYLPPDLLAKVEAAAATNAIAVATQARMDIAAVYRK